MNALKDFWWFFAILIGFGFIWLLSGGPERESSTRPFINPPFPLGSGETYGTNLFSGKESSASDSSDASTEQNKISIKEQLENIENETKKIQEELQKAQEKSSESKYAGKAVLYKGGATQTEPDSEYVEIKIPKTTEGKIVVTGWELKSMMTGQSIKIGEAAWLPRLGDLNTKNTIAMSAGDRMLITTGRSPIGISFRTNKCTGYFGQFQNFWPSLGGGCPDPMDEIPDGNKMGPNAFNDACLDFIDKITNCNVNTKPLPWGMQSQCQEFVTKQIGYNSCIDKHKNDEDFYENEWRIFLARDSEMWKKKREIIKLLDNEGKTVSTVNY